MSSKPLVSFCLFAYNQERFIKEAVESALSQTYSNTEFILSDDCSTDETFACMEAITRLSDRSSQVQLNRMQRNVGLTAHINSVLAKARGDLVVMAAGDDISLPHRTERLVEKWKEIDCGSCSIFSAFELIDEESKILDPRPIHSFPNGPSWVSISDQNHFVLNLCPGCTHAFTPKYHAPFGEIPEGIIQEDICIKLRSSIVGSIGYIPEVLVRYRQTTSSLSRTNQRDYKQRQSRRIRYLESLVQIFCRFEKDCEWAYNTKRLRAEDFKWAMDSARSEIGKMNNELAFLKSNRTHQLLSAFSLKRPYPSRLRRIVYSLFPRFYGLRTRQR